MGLYKMPDIAKKFQREQRYIVLKLKDLNQYATDEQRYQLEKLCNAIASQMPEKARQRKYVVVEDDWAEYEVVWKMIATRMARADVFAAKYKDYLSETDATKVEVAATLVLSSTGVWKLYGLYNIDGDCLADK